MLANLHAECQSGSSNTPASKLTKKKPDEDRLRYPNRTAKEAAKERLSLIATEMDDDKGETRS